MKLKVNSFGLFNASCIGCSITVKKISNILVSPTGKITEKVKESFQTF